MVFFHAVLRPIRQFSSVLLLLLVPTGSVVAQEFNEFLFEKTARELIGGLRDTKLVDISSSAGYEAPKVALRAFDVENSEISLSDAQEINRYLLSDLQRYGGQDFHFVDRENLEILQEEVEEFSSAADKSLRQQALTENSRADVVIISRLRKSNIGITASYQALVTETGQILVSTTPRQVVSFSPRPITTAELVKDPFVKQTARSKTAYRANVEQAEIRLEELGYEPGAIDGYLTDKTRAALREYQADSALAVNGRLTRKTFRNMFLDTRTVN